MAKKTVIRYVAAHPAFTYLFSLLGLSAAGIWFFLSLGISPFLDVPLGDDESTNRLNHFLVRLAFGNPLLGLLVGLALGAIVITISIRRMRRFPDLYAENFYGTGRFAELRFPHRGRRFLDIAALIVILFAICAATGASAKIGAYSIFIPFFLEFAAQNEVYRRVVARAAAEYGVAEATLRKRARRWVVLWSVVVMGLIGGTTVFLYLEGMPEVITGMRAAALSMQGMYLTEEGARDLKKRIEKNPNDVNARVTLLAYQFGAASKPTGYSEEYAANLAWLIEHRPSHPVHEDPSSWAMAGVSPVAVEELANLWLANVRSKPTDVRIATHAANFFSFSHSANASDLLSKGKEAAPGFSIWDEKLEELKREQRRRAKISN